MAGKKFTYEKARRHFTEIHIKSMIKPTKEFKKSEWRSFLLGRYVNGVITQKELKAWIDKARF